MTTNKRRIYLPPVYNAAHLPPSEEEKHNPAGWLKLTPPEKTQTSGLCIWFICHYEKKLFFPTGHSGSYAVKHKVGAFWTQLNGIRRGTAVDRGLLSSAGSFPGWNHVLCPATSISTCTGRSWKEWTDFNCDLSADRTRLRLWIVTAADQVLMLIRASAWLVNHRVGGA